MNRAILYVHGGSGNHGCEAIVRTMVNLLQACGVKNVVAMAINPSEDKKYELDKVVELWNATSEYSKRTWRFIYAYCMHKILGKYMYLDILSYRKVIDNLCNNDVAFAIGGDTYSYSHSDNNAYMHDLYRKKGLKTVLWGCSIEQKSLENAQTLADVKNFDLVVARESLTFGLLKKYGVERVEMIPDTAFLLPQKNVKLPQGFVEGNTVGINVSPMIIGYEKDRGIVMRNYIRLIDYILSETDMNVALIPHVIWENNDDRGPLSELYKRFSYTGRVLLIEDCCAEELKGYIAHCRYMVAARTHASIAAYSSSVPTLVVGYSIKAQGIATDLFGTADNYVVPAQSLMNETDLSSAFKWFEKNESDIKTHLQTFIPLYQQRVVEAEKVIKSL